MEFERVAGAVGTVRDRPALFAGGLAIGAADVASVWLLGTGTELLADSPWQGLGVVVLGRLLLLAAVALVLPGMYASVRGEPGSLRTGLASLVTAARESSRALFAASLVAHAVAFAVFVPLAVAATGVALGVDTGRQVLAGTAGGGSWLGPALVVFVAWTLTGFVARLPFAFHDLRTVDSDAGPLQASRASARATLARPRDLVAYGLPRLLLLAAPPLLALTAVVLVGEFARSVFGVGRTRDALMLAAFIGPYVLASGVARPVLAAVHVRFAAEQFAFRDVGVDPLGALPRTRTVVVGIVLLATVTGGVAAVRVADDGLSEGPPPAPDVGEDDPSAVLAAATERTGASSYRAVHEVERYNDTRDEWQPSFRGEVRTDTTDRQLLVRMRGPDLPRSYVGYVSDGYAAASGPVYPTEVSSNFRRHSSRGNWSIATGPPTDFLDETTETYPESGLPWQVLNRTDAVVVYGLSDPAALQRFEAHGAHFPSPADEAITYRSGNDARVAVDRDTGRLAWLRVQSRYAYHDDFANETDERGQRRVVRFENYGSTDVERPESLRGPSVYATLWDAVAY